MTDDRRITLANGACTAVFTDLGARLLELHVPDAHGTLADVVLGRPSLAEVDEAPRSGAAPTASATAASTSTVCRSG